KRAELAPALHRRKTELLEEMVDAGVIELRSGAARLVGELAGAGVARAVGTTGSRRWVERLLRHTLGDVDWDVIVAGDDVTHRKPDPEVFATATKELGSDAGDVVVVEDSAEGLQAARAAGLCCVVVVNGYTAGHDLGGADLVLDGFGEPGTPAVVLADPHATGCEGILTTGVLRTLLRKASR
ncbi:MAG: HAD-IA family hydrolase, partial [Acidimicrobiales bacterium]|nr:HAD-IA family hydrolase [Acidimicrobiales bacterium]